MAILKKIYKKDNYNDRYIIDKVLNPLIKGFKGITVGKGLTLGKIIQEKLQTASLSKEQLIELRDIALNPDIDFMMKSLSYHEGYAICFEKVFKIDSRLSKEDKIKLLKSMIEEKHHIINQIRGSNENC
jgi:hypothetical protein